MNLTIENVLDTLAWGTMIAVAVAGLIFLAFIILSNLWDPIILSFGAAFWFMLCYCWLMYRYGSVKR